VRELTKLIEDPAYRQSLEKNIVANYKTRSWNDIADDIYCAATRVQAKEPWLPGTADLSVGQIYHFGNATLPEWKDSPTGDVMKRLADWHQSEGWGVWAKTRKARLEFTLSTELEQPVFYFVLKSGPKHRSGPKHPLIRVDINKHVSDEVEVTPSGKNIRCSFRVKPQIGARIDLSLCTNDLTDLREDSDGPRKVGVGLICLMVCDQADVVSRLEFVERFCSTKALCIE
jgi:hypothetical protein